MFWHSYLLYWTQSHRNLWNFCSIFFNAPMVWTFVENGFGPIPICVCLRAHRWLGTIVWSNRVVLVSSNICVSFQRFIILTSLNFRLFAENHCVQSRRGSNPRQANFKPRLVPNGCPASMFSFDSNLVSVLRHIQDNPHGPGVTDIRLSHVLFHIRLQLFISFVVSHTLSSFVPQTRKTRKYFFTTFVWVLASFNP